MQDSLSAMSNAAGSETFAPKEDAKPSHVFVNQLTPRALEDPKLAMIHTDQAASFSVTPDKKTRWNFPFGHAINMKFKTNDNRCKNGRKDKRARNLDKSRCKSSLDLSYPIDSNWDASDDSDNNRVAVQASEELRMKTEMDGKILVKCHSDAVLNKNILSKNSSCVDLFNYDCQSNFNVLQTSGNSEKNESVIFHDKKVLPSKRSKQHCSAISTLNQKTRTISDLINTNCDANKGKIRQFVQTERYYNNAKHAPISSFPDEYQDDVISNGWKTNAFSTTNHLTVSNKPCISSTSTKVVLATLDIGKNCVTEFTSSCDDIDRCSGSTREKSVECDTGLLRTPDDLIQQAGTEGLPLQFTSRIPQEYCQETINCLENEPRSQAMQTIQYSGKVDHKTNIEIPNVSSSCMENGSHILRINLNSLKFRKSSECIDNNGNNNKSSFSTNSHSCNSDKAHVAKMICHGDKTKNANNSFSSLRSMISNKEHNTVDKIEKCYTGHHSDQVDTTKNSKIINSDIEHINNTLFDSTSINESTLINIGSDLNYYQCSSLLDESNKTAQSNHFKIKTPQNNLQRFIQINEKSTRTARTAPLNSETSIYYNLYKTSNETDNSILQSNCENSARIVRPTKLKYDEISKNESNNSTNTFFVPNKPLRFSSICDPVSENDFENETCFETQDMNKCDSGIQPVTNAFTCPTLSRVNDEFQKTETFPFVGSRISCEVTTKYAPHFEKVRTYKDDSSSQKQDILKIKNYSYCSSQSVCRTYSEPIREKQRRITQKQSRCLNKTSVISSMSDLNEERIEPLGKHRSRSIDCTLPIEIITERRSPMVNRESLHRKTSLPPVNISHANDGIHLNKKSLSKIRNKSSPENAFVQMEGVFRSDSEGIDPEIYKPRTVQNDYDDQMKNDCTTNMTKRTTVIDQEKFISNVISHKSNAFNKNVQSSISNCGRKIGWTSTSPFWNKPPATASMKTKPNLTLNDNESKALRASSHQSAIKTNEAEESVIKKHEFYVGGNNNFNCNTIDHEKIHIGTEVKCQSAENAFNTQEHCDSTGKDNSTSLGGVGVKNDQNYFDLSNNPLSVRSRAASLSRRCAVTYDPKTLLLSKTTKKMHNKGVLSSYFNRNGTKLSILTKSELKCDSTGSLNLCSDEHSDSSEDTVNNDKNKDTHIDKFMTNALSQSSEEIQNCSQKGSEFSASSRFYIPTIIASRAVYHSQSSVELNQIDSTPATSYDPLEPISSDTVCNTIGTSNLIEKVDDTRTLSPSSTSAADTVLYPFKSPYDLVRFGKNKNKHQLLIDSYQLPKVIAEELCLFLLHL